MLKSLPTSMVLEKPSQAAGLVTQCRHPSRRWVIKCHAWFYRIVVIMSGCRPEDQSSILCRTAIKIRTANVFLMIQGIRCCWFESNSPHHGEIAQWQSAYRNKRILLSGSGSVWQSGWFGTIRSQVRILSPRPAIKQQSYLLYLGRKLLYPLFV